MTAEVAILNKTAVALAADSAVTISAGSDQQKIYDSADKLFELSECDPIGVMVNGDLNFMQIPISVLIKMYREDRKEFARVPEAANSFLEYLSEYGVRAPDAVKDEYVRMGLRPLFERVKERANEAILNRIFSLEPGGDFQAKMAALREEMFLEQLAVMRNALDRVPDAKFVGTDEFTPTERNSTVIAEMANSIFEDTSDRIVQNAIDLGLISLKKKGTGPTNTGVIVAGFGKNDLFPTLVPYEVYGVVGDRLKYWEADVVDIDRSGTRAKVLPFAQREMVERFLYGLDEGIRRNISSFCRAAVPEIRRKVLDKLDIDPDSKETLEKDAEDAELAFLDGLRKDSFDAIRSQSQAEIEDMVEFMPKPEMARMAEALVNLTSIKRRVSRGMETVGGPIDVAVISRSEGFVWVHRKHYFPPELNSRFFQRKRAELQGGGTGDG